MVGEKQSLRGTAGTLVKENVPTDRHAQTVQFSQLWPKPQIKPHGTMPKGETWPDSPKGGITVFYRFGVKKVIFTQPTSIGTWLFGTVNPDWSLVGTVRLRFVVRPNR